MASVYSGASWTGDYTYTRVRVDYNGRTATAHLLYTRTNTWSGATGSGDATFTFGGASVAFNQTRYGQMTDSELASVSFSISAGGGTYSGSSSGGYMGGSWSVSIPSQRTAPSGLSCSNIRRGIESFTATVGLSSWGNYVEDWTKYRELQCWTKSDSGLVEPRRWQPTAKSSSCPLSGDITVSNSSSVTSGSSFRITGNTMYTLGVYADNGYTNTGSQRVGNYTTLPYAATLSLNKAHSSSLDINCATPANGNAYPQKIQYSIDGGTTWKDGITVTGSSAQTNVMTISGLNANTQYTIKSRVTTSAGTTNNADFTAKTIGPETPTLSVVNNGSVYSTQIATYGTTTFGGGADGVVYLYRGTSTAPTTIVDKTTTTGNKTFNNTGLAGNQIYYYRARAGAYFGGDNLYDYKAMTSRTHSTVDSNGWVTATFDNTSGTSSAFANFWGGPLPLQESTNYSIVAEIQSFSSSGTGTGDPNLTVVSAGYTPSQFTQTWRLDFSALTANTTYVAQRTTVSDFTGKNAGLRSYVTIPAGKSVTIKYRISVLSDTTVTPSTFTYQAYNSGAWVWSDYSSEVSLVTRLPRPTIQSGAVIQYETASTVKVRLSVRVPADNGYYNTKDVLYRYSTDGGSTWTSWTSGATINVNTQTDVNVDISGLAVDTNYRFQVVTRTPNQSNSSNSHTFNLKTSGQHQPPTNFNYSIIDNNTALQNWLATFAGYTNPVYVQGKSQVRASIPNATKGTCTDGATITKYVHTLVVDNQTITTNNPSSYPATVNFGNNKPINRSTDFPSNVVTIRGRVYDSLDTYTEVNKTALSLSWEAPKISVTGEWLAQMGNARIDITGSYARLQDNSLNSGNDMNNITIQYRALDLDDNVLIDWTTLTDYQTTIDSNKPFLRNFTGRANLTGLPAGKECQIEVRIDDHFVSATGETILEIWSANQIHNPVVCDIELWDWKTNTFVADLSYLVIGDLNITWELNDVEEVSFDMDLMEFEKKCDEMGLDSEELLKPYAHDIRIRRNGEYIVGCQLVDVDIQISNNPPSKISVKGTGFLNLLKDQYVLSEAWSGYTYAQIARRLVESAQKPDCLIKNPTGDIDTSYWLSAHGTIAYSSSAHSGSGCISASRSGAGWISAGTQMNTDTGQAINIDVWVRGQSGVICYVREREYLTVSNTQQTPGQITLNGSWQHLQINNYMTFFQDGYILFECNRTDSSTPLRVDDCYVYPTNDNATLCNMNIPLGVDTASPVQANNRQVNYELQNVKDALTDLTNMEDDNFEFEFEPDRTFNIYARKGADKLDLEVAYPGNVDSMTISRSAANVANKIIAIGSGIGDERLQTEVYNNTSRAVIGTRESITTDSNISLESTLRSKAIGNLYDRKDPTNIPRITIKDSSINPSNIETGDVVLVETRGEHFIESTTGEYRVMKIAYTLTEDSVEQMVLTVEPPLQRPEKKMVRYIRDSIAGSTANGSNHWVEVQALMLSGNEYINVARGKTVTCSFTPSGTGHTDPQIIVDGNTTTEQNYLNQNANNTIGAVTIDLGGEYPIDYVRVWHYWQDARSYKNDTLSVGTSLVGGATGSAPLSDILWQYSGQAYVETSQGKRSKWIQEDNVVEG